jgi:hypothetical protein
MSNFTGVSAIVLGKAISFSMDVRAVGPPFFFIGAWLEDRGLTAGYCISPANLSCKGPSP